MSPAPTRLTLAASVERSMYKSRTTGAMRVASTTAGIRFGEETGAPVSITSPVRLLYRCPRLKRTSRFCWTSRRSTFRASVICVDGRRVSTGEGKEAKLWVQRELGGRRRSCRAPSEAGTGGSDEEVGSGKRNPTPLMAAALYRTASPIFVGGLHTRAFPVVAPSWP
jgi:hypothetical protein